jgi:hypothetical protein
MSYIGGIAMLGQDFLSAQIFCHGFSRALIQLIAVIFQSNINGIGKVLGNYGCLLLVGE